MVVAHDTRCKKAIAMPHKPNRMPSIGRIGIVWTSCDLICVWSMWHDCVPVVYALRKAWVLCAHFGVPHLPDVPRKMHCDK